MRRRDDEFTQQIYQVSVGEFHAGRARGRWQEAGHLENPYCRSCTVYRMRGMAVCSAINMKGNWSSVCVLPQCTLVLHTGRRAAPPRPRVTNPDPAHPTRPQTSRTAFIRNLRAALEARDAWYREKLRGLRARHDTQLAAVRHSSAVEMQQRQVSGTTREARRVRARRQGVTKIAVLGQQRRRARGGVRHRGQRMGGMALWWRGGGS